MSKAARHAAGDDERSVGDEPAPMRALCLGFDPARERAIRGHLELARCAVRTRLAGNIGEFRELLASNEFDVVLARLDPANTAAAVIADVRRTDPEMPLVALVASISPEDAVDLVRKGVHDVVRLDDGERLAAVLRRLEANDNCAGARSGRWNPAAETEFARVSAGQADLACRFGAHGQLSDVNEAFCRFLDLPRKAVVGRFLREFVLPRDSIGIRRQLGLLGAGGSAVETYRLVDGDGRPRWIRWVARIVPGEAGSEIEAVGHDVTAQREAELAVAESEQRFRIAAECATDLIYECSFDGSTLNWYGPRHDGRPGFELPDNRRDWTAMIDPRDRSHVRRVLDDHLKTGQPYEVEYRVADTLGGSRHLVDRGSVTFDERGDPYKWIGAIDDVTETRLAERALRENQARLNYRLSLERIISELSSRLHACEDERDIGEALRPALERIGSIMSLDRGYVIVLSVDGKTFSRMHEWCAEGVEPHRHLSRAAPVEAWHELVDAYAAGEVVHAAAVEQVEPRFESLRRCMIANRIRSVVTVPIFHDRHLSGVLGFETERRQCEWLAEDVRLLKTSGEIIGHAIGNSRNRSRILETNRCLACLDQISRALSGRASVDDVLGALVEVTLDIFDADRVMAAFPCDPRARQLRVYRQAAAPGVEPIPEEGHEPFRLLAPVMEKALSQAAPVVEPPDDGRSARGLCLALPVRVGKPWLLYIDGVRGDLLEADLQLAAALGERAVDSLSEAQLLEQLRENELRLDEAQGVAHVGSWEADWNENRLWWSTEAFNIFEMDPGDFDAEVETFFRYVHPDDAGVARHEFERSLARRAPYDHVYRLQLPGGGVKHVNVRCVTRYDDAGRPLRSIGTIQDVSAQKHFEDALRQTQKLEAVGQLTGGIAHDFNNLLSIILGNLDLVLRDVNTDPRLAQRVDTARRAAQRGADLTRKLLSVSRKNEPRPKQIDVNRVLGDMEELITRSLTPQVHVRTRLDDNLANAVVDPGALQDALLNLVINARDAMPTGGELVIATRNVSRDRPPADDDSRSTIERLVCVTVTDNGVGMPGDVVEHALEPFFTTKEPGKGTGLGLAMVYAFVTQAGGYMDIDSAPGQGTRVNLFLPAAAENVRPEPSPDDERSELVGGSEKILIVDDEAELVELAEELLTALGYRTTVAHDAREALERISSDADIDLVFSDILMPGGMDGYELARRARELSPGVKVLLCSGYAQRMDDGSFDGVVLRKPYEAEELCAAIRRALES